MTRWLAVVVALGLVGIVWSDEPKKGAGIPEDVIKALAEAGKPGSEHEKLQPLAGNWTYTCKMWMDPSKPPVESKGTIARQWVLGGRFLEEKVAGTNFDGKPGFEGRGLLGYDNAQKKYTLTWACTMCTSACTSQGSSDAAGTTFTFQKEVFCPVEKKLLNARDELRIEANDKVVMESYVTRNGKEAKIMEIVETRQK